jgi:hypothetical protein
VSAAGYDWKLIKHRHDCGEPLETNPGGAAALEARDRRLVDAGPVGELPLREAGATARLPDCPADELESARNVRVQDFGWHALSQPRAARLAVISGDRYSPYAHTNQHNKFTGALGARVTLVLGDLQNATMGDP